MLHKHKISHNGKNDFSHSYELAAKEHLVAERDYFPHTLFGIITRRYIAKTNLVRTRNGKRVTTQSKVPINTHINIVYPYNTHFYRKPAIVEGCNLVIKYIRVCTTFSRV